MLLHSALQYFSLVWFLAQNVKEGVTEVVEKKSKMGGLVAGGAESMGELSCLSSFVLDQKKTHFSLFSSSFSSFSLAPDSTSSHIEALPNPCMITH